jgi:C4-dicarboxylate transporter, DctM subunit
VLSLGLAAINRKLTAGMLLQSFEGTVRTTSMIMLIILAAMILNIVVGFFGAIQAATQLVADLGLEPWQLMAVVVVFYLIIGMFMETFSMMLTTIGIVFPLVTSMGYDPIWFGVVVVLLMEAALITPPIGVNLFVVQGIRKGGAPFRDVCIGATPFLVAMLILIVLLIWQPGIATWLPDLVYDR